MADKKISQLTSAVLPLAGTEVVPVVQSGATVKVSAASLGAAAAYTPAGTGAVVSTVQSKLRESVSVKDFGAVGDGVTDDTAAIAAAWAASKYITFPAGTYKVSSLPNFASNGARIDTIGKVTITYTGTGNGLVVDAGSGVGVKNYDIYIGPMTIIGTASATNGVYIRGITHSTFRRLRPINFPTSAMRCEFMVSNYFEEFCYSGNEAGITVPTLNGIVLEKRNAGEQSSNCTFVNPIVEGTTGDGLRLNEAIICTFIGGTSEGNGTAGGAGAIYIGANSGENTFIGLDMEANGKAGDATSYHVKDYGLRNKFVNCLADSVISPLFWVAGGNSLNINGGIIANLQIDAGVKNTSTLGMAYTGTITNAGTNTRHIQLYNVGSGTTLPDSYVTKSTWTPTATSLTVVGTPTYAGTFERIGDMVSFTIRVTSTTSTAATAGATTFTAPTSTVIPGTCVAASNVTGQGLGTGLINSNVIYVPTWAASADIVITGQYFAA